MDVKKLNIFASFSRYYGGDFAPTYAVPGLFVHKSLSTISLLVFLAAILIRFSILLFFRKLKLRHFMAWLKKMTKMNKGFIKIQF